MSVSIDGTNGLTFSDATTQNTGGYTGFRNRIINGAMMIDQRNAGASVTASTAFANIYTLDRWYYSVTAASKFSVQRNAGAVTTPAGFTNYLGVTSLSAYSVSSSDALSIRQNIEGFNTADLAWGTASASAVTLSFWARSSLTGTFGGSLANASVNRCYPFSFVISSANTWEYKTITVAGDTSGTWATDNSTGIILNFSMGTGSTGSGTAGSWGSTFFNSTTGATSVVGTSGATFYITGCQLEKGSVATPFEFRQYGTELALCQRYYYRISGFDINERVFAVGLQQNVNSVVTCVNLAQTMRSIPTVSGNEIYASDQTGWTVLATLGGVQMNTNGGTVSASIASNGAQYRPVFLIFKTATGWIGFNSEL